MAAHTSPPQECCGMHAQTLNPHGHGPYYYYQSAEAVQRRSRTSDVILGILAVVCPPGVAFIKTGRKDLALNIVLTLFGWFPGILHAWYLLILYPHLHHSGSHGALYQHGPYMEAQEEASPTVKPKGTLSKGRPPSYGYQSAAESDVKDA